MPEASVDEDRDPMLGEHDVGASPKTPLGGHRDAVSKALCVQEPTDRQFRLGVSRAVRLHVATPSGGRGP